jgi:hypothetical protein
LILAGHDNVLDTRGFPPYCLDRAQEILVDDKNFGVPEVDQRSELFAPAVEVQGGKNGSDQRACIDRLDKLGLVVEHNAYTVFGPD